ncbi:MAG: hypothetical protein GXP41_05145 [Chloroflexi bacterium]|nr:hypothetical protein [Chloroflexota bacterium]
MKRAEHEMANIKLYKIKRGKAMQRYYVETTVSSNGTVTIKGLPFLAGDKVEVTVRGREPERKSGNRYPLRGKPIRYVAPYNSVAEADWDILE